MLERRREALSEPAQPGRVYGVDPRDLCFFDSSAGCAFDVLEQVAFPRGHEQDRVPGTPCAACAADAVDIGFGVVRDVVVEHVRDTFNVEPACGNVGRNEDVDHAVAELIHRLLALDLRDIAVDRRGTEATGLELGRDVFGRLAGAHESDHAVGIFGFQQARHDVELVLVHDLDVALTDVRARGRCGVHCDVLRVAEVGVGDAADLLGHGRREQRDLLVFRRGFEDRVHGFGEAHT